MNNQEVAAELRRIAQVLEDHLTWMRQQSDARERAAEQQRQAIIAGNVRMPHGQVRRLSDAEHDAMLAGNSELVEPRAGFPWPTPATVDQGFLSARWQRRDGTGFGAAVALGHGGPNSPIRGGDDAQAQVDVPSGARRS